MAAMTPYMGASSDLGLGAQAAQEAQDEIERIKKKKLADQKASGGQPNAAPMAPNTASFLSLSGNQY